MLLYCIPGLENIVFRFIVIGVSLYNNESFCVCVIVCVSTFCTCAHCTQVTHTYSITTLSLITVPIKNTRVLKYTHTQFLFIENATQCHTTSQKRPR